MSELKPCPFCGGAVRFIHNIEMEPDGIICDRCKIVTRFMRIKVNNGERFGVVMSKMAEAWNKRVGERE